MVREKAQEFIQQIMEEEVTELLGREKSERRSTSCANSRPCRGTWCVSALAPISCLFLRCCGSGAVDGQRYEIRLEELLVVPHFAPLKAVEFPVHRPRRMVGRKMLNVQLEFFCSLSSDDLSVSAIGPRIQELLNDGGVWNR